MPGIDSATGVLYANGDFYDHILNDMFLPAVADTVINPNETLRLLPRDKTRVQGKMVVYPVHTGRNRGGNAIGPDGNLPDPEAQQYDGYRFPIKHLYHRIKFDGITMDASKSDVASWLRVVESEVKGAATDMARRRNRIFNNDGSGRLAQVVSGGGTTTLVLQINQGIEDPDTVPTSLFAPTRFLSAGQRLMFTTSAGATPVVTTVVSVNSAIEIEVALGTGIANGDWVVEVSRTGTTALVDGAYQNEPMGLEGIFSDANPADGTATGFQGVDATAAANAWHRANVLDGGGVSRALTEALMQRAFSDTIRIGEGMIDCLHGSFGIVNTYIDLLIGDKRFVNTTKLAGGASAVTFNDIPFIAERDAYSNRIKFLDKGNLRVYVMADPQWMSYDGSTFNRMSDKDGYQATLFCREQLGVDVRDKCTHLTDLTEI